MKLHETDIGSPRAVEFPEPSVIVLSYVLHHLRAQGGVSRFEARLARAGSGSQLVVLGPGDAATTQELMSWRRSFVRRQPQWRPLLPCGQEFGVRLPAACDSCWCARREELHASPLQRAYLERLDQDLLAAGPERRRGIHREFERLSWSYCVLASMHQDSSAEPRGCQDNPGAAPVQRYIGQRRTGARDLLELAEETCPTAKGQVQRLVALCPARIDPSGCQSAALVQEAGKVLPPLRFGELVVLDNVNCRQDGHSAELTMNRASRVRPCADDQRDIPGGLPLYDAQPACLNALARRLFGFSALHDFQHRIIRRVLNGQDTLGIAATGAGKTETFLLPALLFPGLTIVVSPLKSLMQDQWERCDERYGLGAVTTYINGDVPHAERVHRLQALRAGRFKLAFFTPEQLARNYLVAVLRQTNVSMLVIDEVALREPVGP